MSYYPSVWLKDSPELRCLTCGEHIALKHNSYYLSLDFETLERIASIDHYRAPHKCSPEHARLAEAKRIMKLYRERHPGISFEESVNVYNLILSSL